MFFLPLFLRLGVFPGSPDTLAPKISPIARDIVNADVHNRKKKMDLIKETNLPLKQKLFYVRQIM